MRLVWCAVLLAALPGYAQIPAGRWDGTVSFGKVKMPFTLEFRGTAESLTGSFVNGESRIDSTSGTFENGVLRLVFRTLGTRIEASLADGDLKGVYHGIGNGPLPFTANAYCTCSYEGEAGPEIMGVWQAPDGAGRLEIRRRGEDTLATLSRASDELGPFSGRFDGAGFNLRYFDGVRAARMEIDVRKGHGLEVTLIEQGQDAKKFTAVATTKAR